MKQSYEAARAAADLRADVAAGEAALVRVIAEGDRMAAERFASAILRVGEDFKRLDGLVTDPEGPARLDRIRELWARWAAVEVVGRQREEGRAGTLPRLDMLGRAGDDEFAAAIDVMRSQTEIDRREREAVLERVLTP